MSGRIACEAKPVSFGNPASRCSMIVTHGTSGASGHAMKHVDESGSGSVGLPVIGLSRDEGR